MNALPYQQPPESVLLPLVAFLLALHFIAYPLDRLFGCGLLGQIVVGIIWGPVTSWLRLDVQETVVQLGHVGLVLLVYQGSLPSREWNLFSKLAVQGGYARISGCFNRRLGFPLLLRSREFCCRLHCPLCSWSCFARCISVP
jgi:Kef-type K+ transport system membrane component KefB